MKKIIFSSHANNKFGILRKHGFNVTRKMIVSAMETPDKIEMGYKNRKIAQKIIDERHVIRVVFEDIQETERIV